MGYSAGYNVTTGNFNIDIGSAGYPGDSNTIRIGGSAVQQTRAFMFGIASTALAAGADVLIDTSTSQLGIAPSSARYKRDIREMGSASDRLMKLHPMTFRYKNDPHGIRQ